MPSKDFTRSERNLSTKSISQHYHAALAVSQSPLSGKPLRRRFSEQSLIHDSHHNMNGIKCSIKANEGILYCLDKSFMFVPKPATYVQIENIASITMSRVGGAVSASRTFDITMTMKGGAGEHQFSNINRYGKPPIPLPKANPMSF